MTKFSRLFVLALFGMTVLTAVCAAELALASQGRTPYAIVVPDDAIPAETTAGRELQTHLKQMTGADFPVVSAADYAGGPALAIGFSDRLPAKLQPANYPGLGPEEFVIDCDGETILLAGGRPRGALYATYEFLERLGVRWYTPTETLVPSRPELSVDVVPERYTSPFRSRTNVIGNGTTAEWCARNRMNSLIEWSNPGEAYGGGVRQGPDMHTLWRLTSSAVFKTHPEWAAEVDGVRQIEHANNHWGMCLSNESLQDFLVAGTMKWLRAHPDVTDVWFGQNDGSPYCTCAQCRAVYDAHGGQPSAVIAIILNKLAAAVAKERPECRVKTLAYGWSLTPPTDIQVDPRVTIMLCAGFSHFAEIGRNEEAAKFVRDVENWKKVASDFEAYLYSHPTLDYWLPAPCLYNQARNIAHVRDMGVTSLHQEVFGTGTGNGGEFCDLRAWVYTRMAWRPDSDPEALIQDFCHGYYGPEAEKVLYAIHRTEQSHAAGWMPDIRKNISLLVPEYVEPDVVAEIVPLLWNAYDAQENPVYKKRLGYAMLPYLWADYWLAFNGTGHVDAEKGTWGVDMARPALRGKEGRLIRDLMIENQISANALGSSFNPQHLRLADMARQYPCETISDGTTAVVVVPGLMGKMTGFSRNGQDILKGLWGYQLYDYPREGYGRDTFFGRACAAFTASRPSANDVRLKSSTDVGEAMKAFRLEAGNLAYGIGLKASQPVTGSLVSSPRLNLNPDVFGIYPLLYISTAGDDWRLVRLGTAGTMWYQAGALPLNDFAGVMILVAESGKLALKISVDPDTLKSASYMYDRYNFMPEGSGNLLELTFTSQEQTLQAGQTGFMNILYRILGPDEFPELPDLP